MTARGATRIVAGLFTGVIASLLWVLGGGPTSANAADVTSLQLTVHSDCSGSYDHLVGRLGTARGKPNCENAQAAAASHRAVDRRSGRSPVRVSVPTPQVVATYATHSEIEEVARSAATTRPQAEPIVVGFAAARRPGVAANGGDDPARVGRWMSQSEHEAMVSTGRVQPGRFSPHTDVSHPASPTAFSPTNPLTSRYVEFNVPRSSLVQGGKEGWAHIPGPDSIFSRLAVSRGGVPFEYPAAGDIHWVASWIG